MLSLYAEASTQSKRAKVAAAAAEAEPAPENNDDSSSSVVISEALAKFFGTGGREMVKAEAIRRVWEYVKVNHLEVGYYPLRSSSDLDVSL